MKKYDTEKNEKRGGWLEREVETKQRKIQRRRKERRGRSRKNEAQEDVGDAEL
jgi:hypothetical protein